MEERLDRSRGIEMLDLAQGETDSKDYILDLIALLEQPDPEDSDLVGFEHIVEPINVPPEELAKLVRAQDEAIGRLTKLGILEAGVGGLAFGNAVSNDFFASFNMRTAVAGLSATAAWIVIRVLAQAARYAYQEKRIDKPMLDQFLALPELAGTVFSVIVYNRFAVTSIAHLLKQNPGPGPTVGIAAGMAVTEGLIAFLISRSEKVKELFERIPPSITRLVQGTSEGLTLNGVLMALISPALDTEGGRQLPQIVLPAVAAALTATCIITRGTPLRETNLGLSVRTAANQLQAISIASLFLDGAMTMAAGIVGLVEQVPDTVSNIEVPVAVWAPIVAVTAAGFLAYSTYKLAQWCGARNESESEDEEEPNEESPLRP